MNIRKTIAFTTLLAWAFCTSAQSDRIEIPVNNNTETPYVAGIGEDGFFVLIDNPRGGEEGRTVSISRYNDTFSKIWEDNIQYDKSTPLKDVEVFENNLYLLFQNPRQDHFELVRVDGKSNKITRNKIRHLPRLIYGDFIVFKNQLIITGTIGNEVMASKTDLGASTTSPIPMAFRGKDIEITHLAKSNNSIFITVSFTDRRQKYTIVREVEPINGKVINDLVLKPDQNYDVLTAQASVLNGNETVVLGTYALPNSEYTQGFFFSRFSSETEMSRKYNSFADLSNFFSFLNNSAEAKIKKRASRKKSKGKDLKVKYQLLAHEIIMNKDGYLMIGEAYYPVFRTERVYRYYRGVRMYDYVLVFDGYQYTHATVAKMDMNGAVQWDQSFAIDEVKTFKLEEKVSVHTEGMETFLAYNSEGLASMAVATSDGLKPLESKSELVSTTNDRVRFASLGDSDYWYDRNFLFWGYQKISNENSDKKRRRIFYINRISF